MKWRALVLGLGVVLAAATVTWAVVANGGIGLAAQGPVSPPETTVAEEDNTVGAASAIPPTTAETTSTQSSDVGVVG